ncbi:MAG: PfkB family carbohydrate kinase [Acidobacteriota bacterium]
MPTKQAPAEARLLELIDRMAGQPVALMADLVADRFITGSPKRISREAPVLILRHDEERVEPGGGANAAANVAALGGRALLVGVVGDDPNGRDLLAALERKGVATDGVWTKKGYSTPTKVRVLGGDPHGIKQQIVRFDIERPLDLNPEDLAALGERHQALRQQAPRVAIISDYGYGGAAPEQVHRLRELVGPQGTVLCDSRYRLAEFGGSDGVIDGATPNAEEADGLFGSAIGDTPESLCPAGHQMRRDLAVRWLLITRGSRGMSLFEADGSAHLPIHGTSQVADVTGAGDTVIGTLALALAAGATPVESTLLANYAGGIVVMKMGTATASPDELRRAVRRDPRPREELRWDA